MIDSQNKSLSCVFMGSVGHTFHSRQTSFPSERKTKIGTSILFEEGFPALQAFWEFLIGEKTTQAINAEHLARTWSWRVAKLSGDPWGNYDGPAKRRGLIELAGGEKDQRILIKPFMKLA
jgi:hypothetical protein